MLGFPTQRKSFIPQMEICVPQDLNKSLIGLAFLGTPLPRILLKKASVKMASANETPDLFITTSKSVWKTVKTIYSFLKIIKIYNLNILKAALKTERYRG